ncbi:hypothetical protein BGZ76_002185 [Entomortierella beljakovae]|nr:hypothetical protein BGZ76_002185 [Entomortierella beljakovae]
MGKEHDSLQDYDDDDLLSRVHQINDPELLKQLLIQKEQERQGLASNLDLAARLGLDLHQQIQRLELESTLQIQSLQDDKHTLQSKANMTLELQHQLHSSESEVRELTGHNRFLQRELDTCRHELRSFRKELDELSEHMAEISSEMVDAKSKVNSYARRLGEVEQELASTQELNVNLQVQLDNALQKQKQTQSTTSQAVKMIQSDLGKVFSDSDTMRSTLEELETRQIKCEDKVVEMMTNTREYAQLLEEAQETIHTLRIESDMEGRGWSSRGPQAAIWDNLTGENPEQNVQDTEVPKSRTTHHFQVVFGATLHEDNEISDQADELDPMFDANTWESSGANSLGMELGMGSLNDELAGVSRGLDQELLGFVNHTSLDKELENNYLGSQGTLAGELEAVESRSSFNRINELAGGGGVADRGHVLRDFEDGEEIEEIQAMPQRFSLSAELHQRLEENNILQNIFSAKPNWSSTTTTIGITSVLGPVQNSTSSIRDIGRTLSMMTLANQKASTSTSTLNVMMSPKSPSHPSGTFTSVESTTSGPAPVSNLAPSGPSQSFVQVNNTDVGNTSFSSAIASPGARRAAAMDTQNILGLKYLLSAASSSDLSNVITKTNAKSPATPVSSILTKDIKSRPTTATTANGERSTTPGNNGKTLLNSSATKDLKSKIPSSSSSSSSQTKKSNNAPGTRMTSSKPIPIVGSSEGRSGRKLASPAASWSNSSSAIPIPSMSRRPSLPPTSSSPSTPTSASSSKSKRPWN